MREAIGNSYVLNFIITFIILFMLIFVGMSTFTKAFKVKNRIVDIFKEMILSSLNGQSENDDIKNIDAKISISIA